MLAFSAFVPRDPFYQLTIALCFVGILVATVFVFASRPKSKGQPVSTLEAYLKFIYGCFLKPHTGDGSGSQQDALVGFECVEIYELRLNSPGELLQSTG
jgi:betaine lipid synthase